MAIRTRQVKNKRDSNGVLTGRPGTVYDVDIKYTAPDGAKKTYTKRGFATKRDASQHEAEMRTKLQNPGQIASIASQRKQTVANYLNEWVESYARVNLRIGKLYAAGLGTEQDYGEAALWLEKSADAGYKYAQYTLAGLYRDSKGVEQDYVAARELYAKASAFPYAAYELGKLYRDGLGGEADSERAARYFHQAFLGFQVMADSSPDDRLQYRIGWMLLHGVGTEQDEAAALPWLEKAAQGGNPFDKYQLGKLLLTGAEGVPKDPEWALELLTECAEDGSQYAQYTLGKAYLLGQDIPQDQGKAVHWLKLSAEQNNQYARFFLDRVYGSIFSSTASLLYHMGRIFQEQRPQPVGGVQVAVDSKLRRKIREKKIAMGHKPDDHEEQAMG